MTPHKKERPPAGTGGRKSSFGGPDIHDSSASGPFQVMPALTVDEFAALKADIADHGVLVPVEVDTDGTILDGHHRVRACRELDINDWPEVVRDLDDDEAKRRHARRLNMARRHLTRVQKRTLIADEITTDPDRSDRAIGRLLGVDHKTVGSVRRELRGEVPHLAAFSEAIEVADDDLLLQFAAAIYDGWESGTPAALTLAVTADSLVSRLPEAVAPDVAARVRQQVGPVLDALAAEAELENEGGLWPRDGAPEGAFTSHLDGIAAGLDRIDEIYAEIRADLDDTDDVDTVVGWARSGHPLTPDLLAVNAELGRLADELGRLAGFVTDELEAS